MAEESWRVAEMQFAENYKRSEKNGRMCEEKSHIRPKNTF